MKIGGCEAAVTTKARCGYVKFRECGNLLFGKMFSLILKWSVYGSYIRSQFMY